MRIFPRFILMTISLIGLGTASISGGVLSTKINVNTNGFCGYWRFTAPKYTDQIAPSGVLGKSCKIFTFDKKDYIFGPCAVELDEADYSFEILALQNSPTLHISAQSGVTLTNSAHDIGFKPSTPSNGAHNLDILTINIEIKPGRFKGNISFEYINRSLACQNQQTTLPKGAKWHLTTGSRANTLIALDRYDAAYATSQSAIRTIANDKITQLHFKTVDVTITPGYETTHWGIQDVIKTSQSGVQTIPLVPAGDYIFRAKIRGKEDENGALFSLTGNCELQPKTIYIQGAGAYYLSADCATSGFYPTK